MPIYPSEVCREQFNMDKFAEHCPITNKDIIIIKPPKKNSLQSRMVILALAVICIVYVVSISLKQGISINYDILQIEQVGKPCVQPILSQSEVTYVHYPEPTTYDRNECKCTPVRFFAILSMQRSGSGWFETLLNSHNNVSSYGEIFSVKERRANLTTITAALDKVYNLDWFNSASKNECTAAVGFKWMLNQGLLQNYEGIVSYFNRRGVTPIFLFRRNLLRRLVSTLANSHDRNTKQLNGTHKAHVHSKDEANILARYKPTIDSSNLKSTLKQTNQMAADALEYFKNTQHIVLYYEDLINNHTKLTDVLNFLRLPPRRLVSRQVKIHTKPLSDHIENYKEVSSILKGTEYESFLQSDYRPFKD